MSKVITVSRFFPQYHPRKGEPTYFIEKIWDSIAPLNTGMYELNKNIEKEVVKEFIESLSFLPYYPKHHTIRAGKRWRTGDKASIRVWGDDINPKSGRKGAYHSKQITIAPDVEVTVFDFEIKNDEADEPSIYIEGKFYCQIGAVDSELIAKNDGLTLEDMKSWFNYPKEFSGQIICFNKNIKY